MEPTTFTINYTRTTPIEYAVPSARAKGLWKQPTATINPDGTRVETPAVITNEEAVAFLQQRAKEVMDRETSPVAIQCNPDVAVAQKALEDAQAAVKEWDSLSNVVTATIQ